MVNIALKSNSGPIIMHRAFISDFVFISFVHIFGYYDPSGFSDLSATTYGSQLNIILLNY
jgi:hypothetical protein